MLANIVVINTGSNNGTSYITLMIEPVVRTEAATTTLTVVKFVTAIL